jgi:hypothetical protein
MQTSLERLVNLPQLSMAQRADKTQHVHSVYRMMHGPYSKRGPKSLVPETNRTSLEVSGLTSVDVPTRRAEGGDHVFWSRVGRTRRRETWWKRLDAYLSSCDSLKYSSAGYAQVAAMYRTDDGPAER